MVIEKWYITLTKHVISGPDSYFARGLWHLGDFCGIFLPNIIEDPKNSFYLGAGPWHCAIWQTRRWLLHYVHKKFR